MLLTETPMPGSEPKKGAVAEGEDPPVLADQEVAPAPGGGHDAHDVAHVDVHRGQRAVEAGRLADREHEDPAVGSHQVVALVVVGGHDAHDVGDLDPETREGPEEAGGLADREDEDPAVGTHQVVAGEVVGGHDAHDVVDLDPETRAATRRSREAWPTGKTKTPPSDPARS